MPFLVVSQNPSFFNILTSEDSLNADGTEFMLDICFEDTVEKTEDINSDTSICVRYKVCAVDEIKGKGFWDTDADEFINEFGEVVFYLQDLTELDLGE